MYNVPRAMIGQRLGPYEILSLLGSGGMGEVYRARDTTLGRDVAIKILPESLVGDADRRARFEREARLLASLNHPHIAAVYGFEHGGATHGLVLELVEGETLANRLRRGPLPQDEALHVAQQVADALAAAHDKGIVHRDLKPANISITLDGAVKVLDFGLAKISTPSGALGSDTGSPGPNALDRSPTVTVGGTFEGIILGTAAYMSPEQARGKAVDKRTDIWAFGCVLYETLTGAMTFTGETVSDVIAAILEREPLWERLPPATSPGIRRLLRRCLEKDPKRRLHDIADARIEIDEALDPRRSDDHIAPVAVARRAPTALWAVVGLIVGALIAVVAWPLITNRAPNAITRFTIDLPPQVELNEPMALAPDGRTLVYSGSDRTGRRLYRRALESLESVPIRGTDGGTAPFFSPDGTSLGFLVGPALKTIPLQGGAAVTLVNTAGGGGAGTWLADGTIVFGTEGGGLRRIPATGGPEEEVTVLDRANGELEHRWPIALPGGRAMLFVVHYGGRDSQQVHAITLPDRKRYSVVQGNGARPLPTHQLVFQRGGSLWVASFDQQQLKLTGAPTAVLEGVDIALDWAPMIGVSAGGSLAYATGGSEPYPPRTLMWVDRNGNEEVIDAPPRSWWWPQISPDGRRLGFHIMDPVNMDAWIYELPQGPLVRVTYHPVQDGYPLWTPDGKHVVFWSRQGGSVAALYLRSADLTGTDRQLTSDSATYQLPFAFSRDGTILVYQALTRDTRSDISTVSIDGRQASRVLIGSPADEARPAISPDGRWIAYQSNASGVWEVYVQPFPDLGGRWQVSPQGGVSPVWSHDGRELFYRNGRAVMTVSVKTAGTTFSHGNPRQLFEGAYVPEERTSVGARSYALARDGRFLMMKEGAEAGQPQGRRIVVISNWSEELKRLAQ